MLNIAARWGQVDNIQVLVDRGVNVNRRDGQGCVALVAAASGGHLVCDPVSLLLQKESNLLCYSLRFRLHGRVD